MTGHEDMTIAEGLKAAAAAAEAKKKKKANVTAGLPRLRETAAAGLARR
jgi:hypothetical protein